MKGVILAGGKGTRLWPLTEVTNKHLIPVGRVPMIEYPLYILNKIGVESISMVVGGEHFQSIVQYLAKIHPEINFLYHYQSGAGGIAQALSLTKFFVKNDKIAVILGDNIFEDSFLEASKEFLNSDLGAMLFLKQVSNPERFGVAEISRNKIVFIEEKPEKPKSNFAVTGLYFYDQSVFDKIATLKPSLRGELEITEVNNLYLKEGRAGYHVIGGFWSDAGTHESRIFCEEFVRREGFEEKIFSLLNQKK